MIVGTGSILYGMGMVFGAVSQPLVWLGCLLMAELLQKECLFAIRAITKLVAIQDIST